MKKEEIENIIAKSLIEATGDGDYLLLSKQECLALYNEFKNSFISYDNITAHNALKRIASFAESK